MSFDARGVTVHAVGVPEGERDGSIVPLHGDVKNPAPSAECRDGRVESGNTDHTFDLPDRQPLPVEP